MFLLALPVAPAEAATESDVKTEQVGGSTPVEGDWVNSTEVNTVEESGIAKRMTQAEKAHNAEVNDRYGFAITIVAMLIVISALLVLSILFLIFGKISSSVQASRKRKVQGIQADVNSNADVDVDSGEAIAAIALALAQHFDSHHDMEDTTLTIRSIKKAYSPWNSKIYNLRHLGELHRNPSHISLKH